jgi:hypothetical protein
MDSFWGSGLGFFKELLSYKQNGMLFVVMQLKFIFRITTPFTKLQETCYDESNGCNTARV